MAKKNSLKNALITSALSLVLCSSALVGTTYAWFTDSVTSNSNIIQTGTLKVDLELLEKDGWNSIKESKKAIFDNNNWEPGYVEVKTLKIQNEGSLALKYKLAIVPNGEVSALADVIDVYILDGQQEVTRDTLADLTPVGTLRDLISNPNGVDSGSLVKEGEKVVTIALKMSEEAGDEYQGMSIGTFSVQLLATQLSAESDSIGPDYDENATLGTYVELNAGDDLMAALASAKEDMPLTVKLNGDVEWPTEVGHGVKDVTSASSVTIDGNGHTLTATGNGVAGLGDTQASMTLKNMTVKDASASYNEASWELSYLEMGGKALNCVNVDFADPIMVESETATFTNCSFVGYKDATNGLDMYGVWMYNGNANFNGCTFTGVRGMKICDMYVGGEVGTVVIDGCIFDNLTQKPGVAIDDRDTQDMNITIKNSAFINCQAGDQSLYIYETDNTVPTLDNNQVINATLGYGEISYLSTSNRWQINTDVVASGVKDLKVNVLDANGNVITTVTPEGYEIPADGNIAGVTVCAVITGNSSSWQNTPFTPSMDAVPTNMQLVINGYVVATNNITVGEKWEDVVAAVSTTVSNAAELNTALANGGYVILANDVALTEGVTVEADANVVLDLNGHKLSATADKSGNQELFLVKGNMTVKNGSLELTATNNQGWGAMATLFDVTAGGVLNMDGVTANVSGTDMNFIVHLNNWGEATLNVNNCDFTTTYCAVRVFNSGYDMNNVTIENTDFHGGRMLWVHNYTAEGKDASTLNLDIYSNNNTSDNANPVRFGFSNSVYYDLDGNVIA